MIKLENITKWFDKSCILRGVNLQLPQGQIVGLTGPSGSGKSVLLKIIAGVLQCDSGQVVFSEKQSANDIGFLFQEGALFDSKTVLDNVCFPLLNDSEVVRKVKRKTCSVEQAQQSAFEILSKVGLDKASLKYPGQLSGGMRRRVALARALVSKPQLVLLDDPTGGLDPVAASVIMKLIGDLHDEYKPTVLIVSHDIRRLLPVVERTLGLFDGVISCDERTKELQKNASKKVLRFLATRYDFASEDSVT